MKPAIWIHRYELQPLRALNSKSSGGVRRGALLRVGAGFADLHPWPELGDATLETQLQALSAGQLTVQLKSSLKLAEIDGRAREAGRSLFVDLEIPRSHFLLTDLAQAPAPLSLVGQGFDRVKVKVGRDLGDELPRLKNSLAEWAAAGIKARLDFNGALSAADADLLFALGGEDFWDAIDFIEDPTPYDAAHWARWSDRCKLRLALDRGLDIRGPLEGVEVLVLKPAIQDPEPLLNFAAAQMKRVVFTSYMDHPLGQMGAAFAAAEAARRHPLLVDTCGLLTHTQFAVNGFSERMRVEGGRLVSVGGHGFGFDDLLGALPWKKFP